MFNDIIIVLNSQDLIAMYLTLYMISVFFRFAKRRLSCVKLSRVIDEMDKTLDFYNETLSFWYVSYVEVKIHSSDGKSNLVQKIIGVAHEAQLSGFNFPCR